MTDILVPEPPRTGLPQFKMKPINEPKKNSVGVRSTIDSTATPMPALIVLTRFADLLSPTELNIGAGRPHRVDPYDDDADLDSLACCTQHLCDIERQQNFKSIAVVKYDGRSTQISGSRCTRPPSVSPMVARTIWQPTSLS